MTSQQNIILYDNFFAIDNTDLNTNNFIDPIENSQYQKEISKIRKIYLNKRLKKKCKTFKLNSKYLNDKEIEVFNIKHKKNKSSIIGCNILLNYENSNVNELLMNNCIFSSNRTEILNNI
jgi:hypothetical protein